MTTRTNDARDLSKDSRDVPRGVPDAIHAACPIERVQVKGEGVHLTQPKRDPIGDRAIAYPLPTSMPWDRSGSFRDCIADRTTSSQSALVLSRFMIDFAIGSRLPRSTLPIRRIAVTSCTREEVLTVRIARFVIRSFSHHCTEHPCVVGLRADCPGGGRMERCRKVACALTAAVLIAGSIGLASPCSGAKPRRQGGSTFLTLGATLSFLDLGLRARLEYRWPAGPGFAVAVGTSLIMDIVANANITGEAPTILPLFRLGRSGALDLALGAPSLMYAGELIDSSLIFSVGGTARLRFAPQSGCGPTCKSVRSSASEETTVRAHQSTMASQCVFPGAVETRRANQGIASNEALSPSILSLLRLCRLPFASSLLSSPSRYFQTRLLSSAGQLPHWCTCGIRRFELASI